MGDERFVGRQDEVSRFAALLVDLMAGTGTQRLRWRARRHVADQAAGTKSRVVLVHGLGGSGKTELLKHFREMAQGAVDGSPLAAGRVRTVWLDWEDEQKRDPGSYIGVAGPSLVTVLDAVQRAVIGAFVEDRRLAEETGRAFDDYRRGASRMPEYAARFADVALALQSRQSGSRFTEQDAAAMLRAVVSAGLVAGGHPGGVLGLTPGQLQAAGQAVGHLSETAIRAVTGKRPGEISPQEYDLVTDPMGELTRRAAAAVRSIAGRAPLVVLLDTGEVIGARAWGWLRSVMSHTSPRVVWVVGARFETEAEAGADSPVAQFVRDIGHEHLVLMSPTRFDDVMIRAYLESRSAGCRYSDAEIDSIAEFTRGLPLAVSFVATLLDEGQSVEEACRDVDDGHPSSVVSQLARRYLVHAEQRVFPSDDPCHDDLMKILGLALAFGDLRSDPDLLVALWKTDEPQSAFQELARRYDFVLPTSRQLHEDVRTTLRADLLDPYRRARAREINQRARALFNERLHGMRRRWPGLDEQLDHLTFTAALLAMLWHTLWTDNQAGLDLFTQVLPALAAADPPAADAAAAVLEQFAGAFDTDQRHDLDLLTRLQPVSPSGWPSSYPGAAASGERRVGISWPGLALFSPGSFGHDPLIGNASDQRAAVMILKARLQAADHDHQAAVATLQMAANQTTSHRLRQAIGSQALEIADHLTWARPPVASWLERRGFQQLPTRSQSSVPTATRLAAAKIATETLTDYASAWRIYAMALDDEGRFADARAASDRALALEPGSAWEPVESVESVIREAGGQTGWENRVREALASADVFVLGHPAGDTSVPSHGTESNLLHFTIDNPVGTEIIMLPVFTNRAAMRSALIRNPDWQQLSVLEVNGGALIDNVTDDVVVVINPWWGGLEFQVPSRMSVPSAPPAKPAADDPTGE